MAGVVAIGYSGVTAGLVRSLSGSVPVGTKPGRFTLDVRDDATPDAIGTLTLTDGFNGTITLAHCALVESRQSGPGRRRITLDDRRWRWRTGFVDGAYNTRLRNGEVDPDRAKTPRQLAGMLLDAMNEPTRDVSLLPNDARPEVNWVQANPADELDRLLSSLGCVLAPTWAGGWKVWPVGEGTLHDVLDGVWLKQSDAATSIRAVPDQIAVACAPVECECVFRLEAVGEEIGGQVKRIGDLSFMPAGGWGTQTPTLDGVTGEQYLAFGDPQPIKMRDHARGSVLRWYRVASMPAGTGAFGLNPPGYTGPDVESIDQLLPLISGVNVISNFNGEERLPAVVWGEHVVPNLFGARARPGTPVAASWTLDPVTGIVKFGEPIYNINETTGALESAVLYLRCAVKVRQVESRAETYYARYQNTGASNGAGAEVLRRPDLVLRFLPTWTVEGELAIGGIIPSNQADIDAECEYHLGLMAAEYAARPSGTVRLSGLHAAELNGQQREVAYSADTRQPPQTTIGVNGSANPYTPDLKQIQRQARFKGDLLGELAKLNRDQPRE